ncbi:MAG TPA: hypothetical protein IAA78_00190 [Candidatus Avamphibacillus intestinigallinarum]|nr:hypothetical protein [Candidatus Avamphibacillus intestinigallinarum]
MKKLFVFICIIMLMVACNSDEERHIKVADELTFKEFNIHMQNAMVYQKDGRDYIDISFNWLNRIGMKATLPKVTQVDVEQDDELLDEVSNAWDDPNGDVRFVTGNNASWKIKLTYALKNTDDPVKIIFDPVTRYDNHKAVEIEIN